MTTTLFLLPNTNLVAQKISPQASLHSNQSQHSKQWIETIQQAPARSQTRLIQAVQKSFLLSSLPIQLLIVLYNVQTLMRRVSEQIRLLQELKTSDSTTPIISGSGNQLLRPRFVHTLGFLSIWESMLSPMSTTTGIPMTKPAQFITLYERL